MFFYVVDALGYFHQFAVCVIYYLVLDKTLLNELAHSLCFQSKSFLEPFPVNNMEKRSFSFLSLVPAYIK